MKIGILTLPLHLNYGGIIQAYALQTILERMGHEVNVLSIDRQKLSLLFMLILMPVRIVKILFGIKVDLLYELHYNQESRLLYKNIEPTLNNKIHRDKRRLESIKERDYEAYVVGSDQIWRPIFIKFVLQSTVSNAYLAFTRNWNVKRVAYAASFGTDDWEYTPEQTQIASNLIKRFDAVSVREIGGMNLCSKYLDVEVAHVLDPTMLLSKDDYIKCFDIEKEPQSEGTLMAYILDTSEEKKLLIEKIALERGLKNFSVGVNCDDLKVPIEERIQPRIEKWLRGFMDAKFVVTDSFHGCVFSIIFNKPFVAIGNKERGMSRFNSLLSMLSLEKNCICNVDEYNPLYPYTIEPNVYNILEENREFSLSFLKNYLK